MRMKENNFAYEDDGKQRNMKIKWYSVSHARKGKEHSRHNVNVKIPKQGKSLIIEAISL